MPIAYRVSVQPISDTSCDNLDIRLISQRHVIASSVIRDACPSARTLKLSADPGQRLNISLTRFNRRPDQSYGTLKDTISGNMVDMTSRDRTQQLMMTVANEAQLQLTALTSDTNFLVNVQGNVGRSIENMFRTKITWSALLLLTCIASFSTRL